MLRVNPYGNGNNGNNNANGHNNANGNANANANANAQQEQPPADQPPMDAEQAQPRPAADNPGYLQIPMEAPGEWQNFNPPMNQMVMQQHPGGPWGGVNLNPPPLPLFLQTGRGAPLDGMQANLPLNPMFMPPHPGARGGGMNLNPPQLPLLQQPHRGERVEEMPFNRPLFMHAHHGAPLDGMQANPPLNQMVMPPYPGAPGVLGNLNAPLNNRLMPPGFGLPELAPIEAPDAKPALKEFRGLLSGPVSVQFINLYLEPSQRFSDDTATGKTALMLAAQAGDEVAVAALMSQTILNRRPSDGVIENYAYHIRHDERERRGVDRVGSMLHADYVNIPIPEALPLHADNTAVLRRQALNARASDGRTPFMFAAEGGNVAVAEKLLAKGADINARTHEGRTALAFAVDHGRGDMVDFLIKAGALRFSDQSIETAIEAIGFSSAASKGHVEVVRILLDELPVLTVFRNARLDQQITDDIYPFPAVNEMLSEARASEQKMLAAAMNENLQIFNEFIEGKSPAWLNSALRTVCSLGLASAVEPLVRRGADANAKTRAGQNALLLALDYGHADVAEKLLENGAVVNRWAQNGRGILSKAAQGGDLKMMRNLLAHMPIQLPFFSPGDFILRAEDDAAAALDIAAERGHVELVRMLLDETPLDTYWPQQIQRASQLAQTAGQEDVVRLLNSVEPVARLLRAAAGVDPFSMDLDTLIRSTPDVNAKLGKERMNPLLVMLENSAERTAFSTRSRSAQVYRHEEVGGKLLRAGVDATVRNGNGDSVLKLATMSLAYGLANKILQSGQCEEPAGEDVRSTLLNNLPRHFQGIVPSIEYTGNASVLDWLIFSEPVSAQANHYDKLRFHRLWPADVDDFEQRHTVMCRAAEKGCVGVILALGREENPEFIRDLMWRAAQSGSWNVMKALIKSGGEDIVDKDIMRTALRTAVTHGNHAAVDDIFKLNELLVDNPRAVSRKLTKEDLDTVFKMLLVEGETSIFSEFPTNFHMLERLFKSAPRALLPTDGWPQGPSEPLAQSALQRYQAWATFDYIWCAQGVSQEAKGRLQAHGLWPLDEENGAQIIFAMEAVVRSGCPHIYLKLRELPALAQWRQSEDNAAAFSAMTQRAVFDAAERSNHSMFELLQSALK